VLGTAMSQHRMLPTAPALEPKEGVLQSGLAAAWDGESDRLVLGAGEHAEHCSDSEEIGGSIVAQHAGEAPIGGDKSAVKLKETESHRGSVGQTAQRAFSFAKGILDPSPRRHGLFEVHDLFAQPGDLVNQLVLGPVCVVHRTM
jgi:hypothetical protein